MSSWYQGLILTLAATGIAVYAVAVLPLRIHVVLSLVILAAAFLVNSLGRKNRLILVGLSMAVAFRYLWWRAFESLNWYGTTLDVGLSLLLFAAEIYAVVILLTGHFQMALFRHRKSVPLWQFEGELPSVDVFIPTYNEDVDIVRRTAIGALSMSYPNKTVYILDDGRREAMAELAKEVGCEYMTRNDNKGAKAGNINLALSKTQGDLVAIFDADHVPTRSFLDLTVGFFLENDRMSLVQTPHHFFNPDPFERNLYLEGRMPPEGDLFYRRIHLGLDFWNASFFCGSCAVLRREAVMQVGGIAQETVTEDAHTALKMHGLGWESAYLSIPQAAGLAVERYASYVSQRIRWARGMAQILRVDPPPFRKGLTIGQRINYFAASSHFFFGLPRLIFILAPLAYLLFGIHPLACNVWDVLCYVSPHLVLSWMIGAKVHGSTRHSFWPEVYEVSVAPYVAYVTTLAVISPKHGKFNVTDKGSVIEKSEYDWRPALPILGLLALCIAGFVFIPLRMAWSPVDASTIVVGGIWNLYNFGIIAAAAMVAFERPQRRLSNRVPWTRDVTVGVFPKNRHPKRTPKRARPRVVLGPDDPRARVAHLRIGRPDGPKSATPTPTPTHRAAPVEHKGRGIDLSEGGVAFWVPTDKELPSVVELTLRSNFGLVTTVDAHPIAQRPENGGFRVSAEFRDLPTEVEHDLIRHMYSAADTWIAEPIREDSVLRSGFAVLVTPTLALLRSLGLVAPPKPPKPSGLPPERSLVVCPECYAAQEAPALVCGSCRTALPQPAKTEETESRAMGILRPGLRWAMVAAAPVFIMTGAAGAGLAWESTLGPMIEAYDIVPRRYNEDFASTLTPVVQETRQLEAELRRSVVNDAPLPSSWSKRMWAVHSRFEDLREGDPKNLPDPAVLTALERNIEQLGELQRQSRANTSPVQLLPRLDEIRSALDGVAQQALNQPSPSTRQSG